MAYAGFKFLKLPGKLKLSAARVGCVANGFPTVAATSSGGSPCRVRTLAMSTSSLERVLLMISMSRSARAHFSVASSWISAKEAVILAGIRTDLGEGAGEDGEGGVTEAEDARRE